MLAARHGVSSPVGARWCAGAGLAHRFVEPNEGSALGKIAAVQEPGDRYLDEIVVGHEQPAIGKREAAGFGDDMHGFE